MTPIEGIPVYSLSDMRKHVQECARLQWSTIKPDRMVCVGMKPFPSSPEQDIGKRAKATIEWFTDMRGLFDLELPLTLIIALNERALILVSGDRVTFTD